MYLKKELFLRKIFQNIQLLWVEQEKEESLIKVKDTLKWRSDIFFDANGSDIYYKTRSIGCTYCTLWKGCTVVLSYKCHRDCFFCYEETPLDPKVKIDPYDKKDMDSIYETIDSALPYADNKTLAITWWEPFLFTDKVYEILDYVNEKYPWKNKRIYTTGEFLNEEKLKKLQLLWLDELRYSIKPWEEPDIELYRLSKKYIKSILIEMPVQPNSKEYMIDILTKINEANCVDWINLNELTFNNLNTYKYRERGLKLDLPDSQSDIYHRYYDVSKIEMWVYGSKLLALELIDYFSLRQAHFFMHYCDLDTVSNHHYIHKRDVANGLWISYASITTFWLQRILRIYGDNSRILDTIHLNRVLHFYNNWNYIETSTDHADIFKTHWFICVIVYKNYDYGYDVDFELIN